MYMFTLAAEMRSLSQLCLGLNYKINTLQSVGKLIHRRILTCAFQPRSDIYPRQLQQPQATCSVVQFSSVTSALTSVWKQMRLKPRRMRYSKFVLRRASLRLYLCCAELPDYSLLMKQLDLDDTFSCWSRLLYLHVWMVLVRLSQEGREGKFVCKELVGHMWKDVDVKSKQLVSSPQRREGIVALFEHFKPCLVSYDRGALGSDAELAGVIWRNIFEMKCADAAHLERMVSYVRQQLAHVDQWSSSELLETGLVRFLPLQNSLESEQRLETVITEIMRRA